MALMAEPQVIDNSKDDSRSLNRDKSYNSKLQKNKKSTDSNSNSNINNAKVTSIDESKNIQINNTQMGMQGLQREDGGKSIFFKDCVILRYEDNSGVTMDNGFMQRFEKNDNNQITFNVSEKEELLSPIKSCINVLNEGGFMNVFSKRANDDFWKTVSYI